MNTYLNRAESLKETIIQWRRDFHRHPELGFQEVRTAGRVAEHLRALGIETITGVGKTGVVGLIEGSRPGPTALLRFDMDALPIQEETGLPFASENPGVMHACGHDGHTAIGMAAAQLLVETSDQWPGRVKLLFQPAEEGLGGALATIEDGVLENPRPDASFALHLWSQLPGGQVVVQSGPLLAAADHFEITIRGRGGHGAQPHTTIDAILVAVQAANALYSIVGRNIPPLEAAVLSIGAFHAGNAFNVIAEEATLSGTLRTFDADVRRTLIERMEAILAGVAQAHGATYQLTFYEHTPAVVNDPRMTEIAARAARRVVGEENIIQAKPIMAAEDMAEIMNRAAGCYIFLGAAPPNRASEPHHSPRFDIDEAQLPLAAALMAQIAVTYLESGETVTQ